MKVKSLEKVMRLADIVFDEAGHTYTKSNGELYTGCTSISGAWRKDFLAPWYAKEAIGAVKERLPEIGLLIQDNPAPEKTPKLLEILDECKGTAKRKSDEAKEAGSLAHDWIEKSISVKIGGGKKPLLPKNPQAKNAVKAFATWAKEKDIKWLASEEVVCSDTYRVAGTLDAIAVVDGLTYLVDFKTSSQLSADYLLQCAGYDIMLRELGVQVMGYLILRIPKDGAAPETLTITDQKDMQFFRETFLKMREAYKFFLLMESKYKDATTRKMRVDVKEEKVVKEAVVVK